MERVRVGVLVNTLLMEDGADNCVPPYVCSVGRGIAAVATGTIRRVLGFAGVAEPRKRGCLLESMGLMFRTMIAEN